MIVLDTNVISEPMRALPDQKVIDWLDGQDLGDLWLTAVTVAELRAGLARLELGARRTILSEKIEDTMEEFEGRILSFGEDAAFVCGDLVGPLLARKTRYEVLDCQIASIVLVHGGVLATRNTTDFVATGVPLINPWTA